MVTIDVDTGFCLHGSFVLTHHLQYSLPTDMPGNLGKSQTPCALEDFMQNAGNTEKSIFLCVLTDCEELAAWSALH